MTRDVLDVAGEFTAAVLSADFERDRAITHPDLRVSYNYRRAEFESISRDEAIANIRRLRTAVTEFGYRDVRRTVTESGYLQLHQAYGVTRSGARFHVDVALIADVVDGLITSYREYADSEQLQVVIRELARAEA